VFHCPTFHNAIITATTVPILITSFLKINANNPMIAIRIPHSTNMIRSNGTIGVVLGVPEKGADNDDVIGIGDM
jgi:hypothetical protein